MHVPWIEILKPTDYEDVVQGENKADPFHALFALQVNLPTLEEQMKFKRGFNLAAYLDENIERQRVFVESQRPVEIKIVRESQEKRTLAIRCINKPEKGLLISIIGKAVGISEGDARKRALSYCREIVSLFPYDYELFPAASREEFHYLVGLDILKSNNETDKIFKIKRYEIPVFSLHDEERISGVWQGGISANEMIWRALGGLSYNIFLNITLRPTIITNEEQQNLKKINHNIIKLLREQSNPSQASIYRQWIEPLVKRRLFPGKKFFYLQVHLVSAEEISDDIIRAVGTAITIEGRTDHPSLGYDILNPIDNEEALLWRKKIYSLEIIPPYKETQTSRLNEMADLDEAFAVCRFPVPPPTGFPGINFLRNDRNAKSDD